MLKYEKYLFHVMVLLALSIIVIPKYYITGDGASHTYNAKVLFDFLLRHDRSYYQEFYQINRSIDPNWTSHLLLGVLVQFFPAWLADKFFQIIYVLVFSYGFRYFIKSIHQENGFVSFLFFPILFTLPFQQGFYNYCLSLGFLFWTLGYYIQKRDRLDNPIIQLSLAAMLLVTTFSHGMPASYTIMIIGLIWLMDSLHLFVPFDFKKIILSASRIGIITLPALLMIFTFMIKRGLYRTPHLWSWNTKLFEFLKMWSSQSTRHAEVYPAVAAGILIFIFFLCSFFVGYAGVSKSSRSLGFVFIFMAGFTFASYMTCPASIGYAGSIDIRLAFLPPLFLLISLSTKNWTPFFKTSFMSLSFIISIVFLIIRFPYVMNASLVGGEIMKASKLIDNKSLVLNIHMDDWQDLSNKDSVFQKDGSFIHVSEYIAAQKNKQIVMVMNYEAELNYFPVNWLPGFNPLYSLKTMLPGSYPPCGDYRNYETQINKKIDYVLIQNPKNYYSCDTEMKSIIQQNFNLIYSNQYVELYKQN